MRAAYLGPPGTNSHDALVAAGLDAEQVALPTVEAVVQAVQGGAVERGMVPIENSREGAVAGTLDALVFDAPDVVIVGELVQGITYCLAGAEPIAPDEVRTVHSHPQALGQCAAFLREQLPGAALVAEPSTADAVRAVAERSDLAGAEPHAAIGTRHAARLYGATILAEGIEDDPDNATRFALLANATQGSDRQASQGSEPHAAAIESPSTTSGSDPTASTQPVRFKTALVFWGGGDLQPGWLVDCLTELSSRAISLTRIESRPRRIGLGHYMFFCDLVGAASNPEVAAAIAGLRGHCEAVRVLGSFPVAA
ncbi:MAG TPA: prephenate dehydratase [Solirubrobacteraceae bacterium]|nr:prephenate dehydratase [Solirubrobacteraceae bacterium]